MISMNSSNNFYKLICIAMQTYEFSLLYFYYTNVEKVFDNKCKAIYTNYSFILLINVIHTFIFPKY